MQDLSTAGSHASPPRGTIHLQKVIDQRHTQAEIQAVSLFPVLLCTQLQRFVESSLLDCHGAVHTPAFLDDSTVQNQVTAIQLHFGERPDARRYRAILRGQRAFGRNQLWITDDNQVPKSATNDHSAAACLIWLRRVATERRSFLMLRVF